MKKLVLCCLIFLFAHPIYADPVPITNIPYFPTSLFRPGWEERGPEFKKWLQTGVRIGGGSGTISYYDVNENWLYIISCGHLFKKGIKTAVEYQQSPRTVDIDVFYHNNQKLTKTKTYKGEVLCHVWRYGIEDVSLMRIHPDWDNPIVSSVVPLDYKLQGKYHNVGCDGKTEVAHYLVTFSSTNISHGFEEIIAKENTARGGRSGGGLLTDEGELCGITSRSDRTTTTWYTSFKQIHKFLKDQGFGFVLTKSLARQIPVVNHNRPQEKLPRNYIPIPIQD